MLNDSSIASLFTSDQLDIEMVCVDMTPPIFEQSYNYLPDLASSAACALEEVKSTRRNLHDRSYQGPEVCNNNIITIGSVKTKSFHNGSFLQIGSLATIPHSDF